MGLHTTIPYCDSTGNLMMGCDGCELWSEKADIRRCYAGKDHERWAGNIGWPQSFDKPTIFSGRIDAILGWSDLTGKDRHNKPWLNGWPRIVFLMDEGDAFTESLDLMWLAPYVERLAASPHIYLLITKRPKRMAEFWRRYGPVPPNFWLLTSVTSQTTRGRIGQLIEIPGATVYGVSYEPALSWVDVFADALWWKCPVCNQASSDEGYCTICDDPQPLKLDWCQLNWVIPGGESGEAPRPFDVGWARRTIEAGRRFGSSVFMKQLGGRPVEYFGAWKKLSLEDPKGENWDEWPAGLRVRQMPAWSPPQRSLFPIVQGEAARR